MVEKLLSIKPFQEHGFILNSTNENHAVGKCPFCQHENKFYINLQTKAWDCKRCQACGGFQTYLKFIAEYAAKNFKDEMAAKLAKNRGISVETLAQYGMGYNPNNGSYTLPIWDNKKKIVVDLRKFTNTKLMSTSTCKTGLWNEHTLEKAEIIFICEGEWDGLALAEKLAQYESTKSIAVCAVPGAGVLKPQWIMNFQKKSVIALYDNDLPGREGSCRCYNMLKSIAGELKFLHWPNNTPAGFDIRDLCKERKDPEIIFDYINQNLRPEPVGDLSERGLVSNDVEVITYDGPGLSTNAVYDGYRKWLYLPSVDILDILYGTIIANRMAGDPVWLFYVAPPGHGKTATLQPFSKAKAIEVMSSLTPRTLVSGISLAGGVDPSWIPRLNKRVLIVKDFTGILTMPIQSRDEIFGQLREAFDGFYNKPFGNGVVRAYESTFGIIAGVTPAIDTYLENEGSLGERFLRWVEESPASTEAHIELLKQSNANILRDMEMKAGLSAVAEKCLDFDFNKLNIKIPSEIDSIIMHLSILLARMRGTVPRDKYTKTITQHAWFEFATRISKQLTKELIGICKFRRRLTATKSELKIVQQLARFSAPIRMNKTLEIINKNFKENSFTYRECAEAIGLPAETAQRNIDNLQMLGLLERNTNELGKFTFHLSNDFLLLRDKSGLYDQIKAK